MPITVLSPFSGKPVKVREQDAGRAVKDEEGRLFYVLPRSDGNGYYGATTRAGNPRDEARAVELENKVARTQGHAKEQVEISLQAVPARRSSKAPLYFIILVIIVAGVAWLFFNGPLKPYNPWAPTAQPPAPSAPAAPSTPAPAAP